MSQASLFEQFLYDLFVEYQENVLSQTITGSLNDTAGLENKNVVWYGTGTVQHIYSANTLGVTLDFVDNAPQPNLVDVAVDLIYSEAPETAIGQKDGSAVPFLAEAQSIQQLGTLLNTDQENKKVSIIFIGKRDSSRSSVDTTVNGQIVKVPMPRFHGFVFIDKDTCVNSKMVESGYSFVSKGAIRINYNDAFGAPGEKSTLLYNKDVTLPSAYIFRYFEYLQVAASKNVRGLHAAVDSATQTFVAEKLKDIKFPGFNAETKSRKQRLLTWNLHNPTSLSVNAVMRKLFEIRPDIVIVQEVSALPNSPFATTMQTAYDYAKSRKKINQTNKVSEYLTDDNASKIFNYTGCHVFKAGMQNFNNSVEWSNMDYVTDIQNNRVNFIDSTFFVNLLKNATYTNNTYKTTINQTIMDFVSSNRMPNDEHAISFADLIGIFGSCLTWPSVPPAKIDMQLASPTSSTNMSNITIYDNQTQLAIPAPAPAENTDTTSILIHLDKKIYGNDLDNTFYNTTLTKNHLRMNIEPMVSIHNTLPDNNEYNLYSVCTEPTFTQTVNDGYSSDVVGIFSTLNMVESRNSCLRPYTLAQLFKDKRVSQTTYDKTIQSLETIMTNQTVVSDETFFGNGLVDPLTQNITIVKEPTLENDKLNIYNTRPVLYSKFSVIPQGQSTPVSLHVVGVHLPSNVSDTQNRMAARRAMAAAIIRYLQDELTINFANDYVIIAGDCNTLQEETDHMTSTSSCLYWLCNYGEADTTKQLDPYSNRLLYSGTYINSSYQNTIVSNVSKFDQIIVSKPVLRDMSVLTGTNPLNLKMWFDTGISTDHVGLSIDLGIIK